MFGGCGWLMRSTILAFDFLGWCGGLGWVGVFGGGGCGIGGGVVLGCFGVAVGCGLFVLVRVCCFWVELGVGGLFLCLLVVVFGGVVCVVCCYWWFFWLVFGGFFGVFGFCWGLGGCVLFVVGVLCGAGFWFVFLLCSFAFVCCCVFFVGLV